MRMTTKTNSSISSKVRLRIEYEDHSADLAAGQFTIVPKGVRHRPVAEEECWLMLIEPVTTAHTGNVESEMTKSIEDQLSLTLAFRVGKEKIGRPRHRRFQEGDQSSAQRSIATHAIFYRGHIAIIG